MISRRVRFLGLALFLLSAALLTAQRRSKNDFGSLAPEATNFVLEGSVALPDAVTPNRIVQIERVCGGKTIGATFADSRGKYTFDLGLVAIDSKPGSPGVPASGFADCLIRASLEGYSSQTIALGPLVKSGKKTLPPIVLQPVGKNPSALMSATDAAASKNAKKDYDKGLDLTAERKWKEAIASIQKAASEDPKFATAWFSMGTLQVSQNDNQGALESYTRAIAADEKFAAPYIDLAVLESTAGLWDKVVEHTNKAIALDPDSFPRAYYLNTMANIRLKKNDVAMKSVAEGIRVDQDHLFPDLQYMQGILLVNKGDLAGARTQLESYLALAPSGDNADNAKQQLQGLPAKK